MHTKTHFLVVGAVLALAFAPCAATAADPPQWYAGLSSSDTHVEVFRGFGWEAGGERHGLSARGGLLVNDHFAVEFGAMHAGNLEWSEYSPSVPGSPTDGGEGRATFDASALQVSAMGILPWGEIFDAYLKVGIAAYRASGQLMLVPWTGSSLSRSVHESGTGHVLGLGLGATVTKNWHVIVEYQYYGIDGAFLGVPSSDDPTIDSFSIGVDYRFGRRP